VKVLTRLAVVGGITVGFAMGVTGCAARAGTAAVCMLPHEENVSLLGPAIPGRPDLSGDTRVGKASFYAGSFAHRLMADGHKMNPQGDNAASRTLPLGTTAKVINLRTGQSAVISIEDRGPYVKGRIVDLSPATARKIGITRRIGIADVKVAPISVRLPDGSLKPGSGAWRKPICRAYSS
jgi:rare lipoprotein A